MSYSLPRILCVCARVCLCVRREKREGDREVGRGFRAPACGPHPQITFIVGEDEQRLEHVTKAILCVRSEYFRTMFGSSMKERDAAEITVPDADLVSFTALVRYLLTDQLDLGEEGERAQRALVLRLLAQKYQVPRLEVLCARALQESVGPATAVPLLEAARKTGDGRLLAQCRRYVADHAAEVRASGGVEQLRDLGVAKGLLGDALDQVAELKRAAIWRGPAIGIWGAGQRRPPYAKVQTYLHVHICF